MTWWGNLVSNYQTKDAPDTMVGGHSRDLPGADDAVQVVESNITLYLS